MKEIVEQLKADPKFEDAFKQKALAAVEAGLGSPEWDALVSSFAESPEELIQLGGSGLAPEARAALGTTTITTCTTLTSVACFTTTTTTTTTDMGKSKIAIAHVQGV
jgi:hypothetical protein